MNKQEEGEEEEVEVEAETDPSHVGIMGGTMVGDMVMAKAMTTVRGMADMDVCIIFITVFNTVKIL